MSIYRCMPYKKGMFACPRIYYSHYGFVVAEIMDPLLNPLGGPKDYRHEDWYKFLDRN